MDYGEVSRQAAEIARANQQARETHVQKLMRELEIKRELAEYLTKLEIRISRLETERK